MSIGDFMDNYAGYSPAIQMMQGKLPTQRALRSLFTPQASVEVEQSMDDAKGVPNYDVSKGEPFKSQFEFGFQQQTPILDNKDLFVDVAGARGAAINPAVYQSNDFGMPVRQEMTNPDIYQSELAPMEFEGIAPMTMDSGTSTGSGLGDMAGTIASIGQGVLKGLMSGGKQQRTSAPPTPRGIDYDISAARQFLLGG